jgi:dethiobiotin synthetase
VLAPLIVVTGTGTGIGKTFVAAGLVRAWAAHRADGPGVLGYKPVESGVVDPRATDAQILTGASTFHVKHPLPHVRLRAPKSPHLAAREEGVIIRLDPIVSAVRDARTAAAGVVVELPGGLFSPVLDDALSIDLATLLEPTALVLVVPDRLGALHDAIAACEAARARGRGPTHVVVNAPEELDASTGTNAAELARLLSIPVLGPIGRGDQASEVFTTLVASIEAAAP